MGTEKTEAIIRDELNEELIAKIQSEDITKTERDKFLVELYSLNTPLFETLGKKWLRGRFDSHRDDVMSTAYEVLHKAVQKFNPLKGTKFATYLYKSLRNKLQDEVHNIKGQFFEVKKSTFSPDYHFSYEPNTDFEIDFDLMTQKLEPLDKDILKLRYVDDLKYKAISDSIHESYGKRIKDTDLYVMAQRSMTKIKHQLETD